MLVINNQNDLDEICDVISLDSVIAIDTEFERRYTYFAKLSIIQIVGSSYEVVIDALANLDLTKFKNILLNKEILKIFHSPREDFEIFYHLLRIIPQHVFDTQIAASVAGYGKVLSYSTLCRNICQVEIDKTLQTANWLQRPLPVAMLHYSIEDVKYLKYLYMHLQAMINEQKLQSTYNYALDSLLSIKNYDVDLAEIWRKVKFYSRSKQFLHKMQVVAAFRESCAMQANLPRRHFATDGDLIKICEYLPRTITALKQLQLTGRHIFDKQYSDKLLELCTGLYDTNDQISNYADSH